MAHSLFEPAPQPFTEKLWRRMRIFTWVLPSARVLPKFLPSNQTRRWHNRRPVWTPGAASSCWKPC